MKKQPQYGHPYEDQCPIVYSFELIGSKWKIPILWFLTHEDGLHYNELKRRITGVTNTMLTRCLREMEEAHLLERHIYDDVPPSVTYHLTPIGKQLLPALNSLSQWGEAHRSLYMKNKKE